MIDKIMNKNQSVATQLTTWLIISILIASTISSFLFSLIMYKTINKDLNREGNELIDYFEGVIEIPLWNFEEDSINLIVKTLSNDPDVESITVKDEKNNILYNTNKKRYSDLITKSRNIYHNNELIGSIIISISRHRYIDRLREVLLSSVFILLTSLIPASILINYLIRIFLRKPFRQLKSLASSYSEGNFDIDIGHVQITEFIPFFKVLDKMGKQITMQLDELKKTTHFLESLKNTDPDAILILTESGIITETNETMRIKYGYNFYDLSGKSIHSIANNDLSIDLVDFNIREALNTNDTSFQWTIKTKDQTLVPVVVRLRKMVIGEDVYIISFLTDIRELIKAESEKKKSEEKYKWLVENLSDEYFFYTVDRNLELSYISPSIQNILGYSVNDYIENYKKYRADNIINKESERQRALILSKNKSKASYDLVIKDIKGKLHTIEITESAVFNSKDKVISIEGIAHDVTDKRTSMEKTRVSQKMEAIGNLAGGIAHDFNNILGAMLGYTELAISETEENTPINVYLSEILKASKRASQLVKQILTFSRQSKNERDYVDLDSLINEVINLLKTSIPVNVKLKYKNINNPGSVLADPVQIHQVLVNLVTNAHQSMADKKGIIDITLDSALITETSSSLTGLQINPGNYALITIKDTGHGIEKEYIDRIFEPYYTTKKHGQGTGLGLSVVHGIIKSHYGKIEIDSTIDVGTTFYIYLPVSDKYSINKNESGEVTVQKGNAKILFVDDNPEFLTVTEKMLENLGCEVTIAETPVKAREILDKSPDSFNLVISDYSMPELNGIEFSKIIYKINKSLPVIICSGTVIDLQEESIDETCIKLFIEKPVSLNQLSEAVKYCTE